MVHHVASQLTESLPFLSFIILQVASRFTIGHDLFECYLTHASRGREGFSKSTAADLRDRTAGVKDSYDAFESRIRSQHARELGFDV